jgi:outer membrane protein insertion porin family
MGVSLRTSYRIFDYTRLYLSYTYDIGDIRNVNFFAAESVKKLEGTNITSAVSTAIRYDSRDRKFNPTEGMNHSLTVQYAGIGGDIGFAKITAESGLYYPVYKKLVFFAHAVGGYVREISGKIIPDYERFYLGGMNSLRGYDWRDISPVEVNSFGLVSKIGGDKKIQFNFELLLPLMEQSGVILVAFFDAGDVYDNHERVDFGNLRQSVGYGFRWYSPMGPIRLEYGHILNPVPGEPSGGSWEFTMGNAF